MYRKSRAVALFLLSLLTVGSLTFGQAFAAGEDSRFDALKRFSQVLDIVERYYVKETPRPDLVNGALKGMLESLDPHSTMLSKEEFKDMQESTSGEFFGIGIEITMENNQLTVVTPIEDTPADKGGMKSGDIILAVGGKPTLEMTLQEAVSHIRGPKGSEVVLTILHRDSKEPVDLRIKRDAIPLISVKSRELEPGYYWVRLTRFSERTTQELLDALSDAKRKGPIKGIILDLRNNPGGLLDQAVSVSDAFLNKGVIVSMRGRQEETAREFVAKPQDTDIIDPPRRARKRRFGLGLGNRGRSARRSEARPARWRTHLRQGVGAEHHPAVRRLGPQADRGALLHAVRPLHPGRRHHARSGSAFRSAEGKARAAQLPAHDP